MTQERDGLTSTNYSELPLMYDSDPEPSSEKMSESNPEETSDQASKTEEVKAQIDVHKITSIDRDQHQGDITVSDVTTAESKSGNLPFKGFDHRDID